MATAIQRRRGTTAQHANFTGLVGEITVDTTLNTLVVHDGATPGGVRLAKFSDLKTSETVTSVSSTSQVAIASVPTSDYRSARFYIQVSNTTDGEHQVSEAIAVHNGSTAAISSVTSAHTAVSAEATFTADVSGGNMRLLATPATSDNITFKVITYNVS